MKKKQNKRLKRIKEQENRLSQFNQETDHYEEKDMGGEIWVKMWNGGTKRWQVGIFSPESFKRYKKGQEHYQEFQHQNEFLRNIT